MVSKYKLNIFFVNLISAVNIFITLSMLVIYISFFQFWSIEEAIFKSNYYRIYNVIGMFIFINIFSAIFSCCSANMKSKLMLKIAKFFSKSCIFFAILLYCATVISFKTYYVSKIDDSSLESNVMSLINARYNNDIYNGIKLYTKEMSSVIYITEFLLISGSMLTLITLFFINILICTSNKENKKNETDIVESSNVAMNDLDLQHIKIVNEK